MGSSDTDGGRSRTCQSSTALDRAYRLAAGEGLADLWWKTGRVRVKASGAETPGRVLAGRGRGSAGVRPARCTSTTARRRASTSSTGEVTVFAGGGRVDLEQPATTRSCPRGVDHAYIVRSERARMLVTRSRPRASSSSSCRRAHRAGRRRERGARRGRAADAGGVHAPARAVRLRGHRPAAVARGPLRLYMCLALPAWHARQLRLVVAPSRPMSAGPRSRAQRRRDTEHRLTDDVDVWVAERLGGRRAVSGPAVVRLGRRGAAAWPRRPRARPAGTWPRPGTVRLGLGYTPRRGHDRRRASRSLEIDALPKEAG